MMKIKVSIIVPVYKVEDYLERCIRSLEDQDLAKEEYEIIVVNDGSPDKCREITMRLMQEFGNIILIDQENKGVSLARNAGMDKAQGDYLLCIDADDYVFPRTLMAAVSKAEETQADVVFLGYHFLDLEGKLVDEVLHDEYKDGHFTGTKAYLLSRGNGKTDPDRSWGILYNRNFINRFNLRYVGGVPYLEDGEFIARVLCMATRCVFWGKKFYIRASRPGSATNSRLFNEQRAIDGFIKAAINLKKFQSQDLSASQITFLNQPIAKFTLLSLQASISQSVFLSFVRVRKMKDQLQKNDLGILNLKGCVPVYQTLGKLYNIRVELFFFVWMIRLLKNKLIPTK